MPVMIASNKLKHFWGLVTLLQEPYHELTL